MTNNEILKKLRITLELKDTDIIEILKRTDFEISQSEVSSSSRPATKCRHSQAQLSSANLQGMMPVFQ
jgi:uncharacterized protein YehS (DUF1456 family)